MSNCIEEVTIREDDFVSDNFPLRGSFAGIDRRAEPFCRLLYTIVVSCYAQNTARCFLSIALVSEHLSGSDVYREGGRRRQDKQREEEKKQE